MNNGAIHNVARRPKRCAVGAGDKSTLRKAQNLKLLQPASAESGSHRLRSPHSQVHVPERTVIGSYGRNTTQDIKWTTITTQSRVQTTASGMANALLLHVGREISVGVSIDDNKDAFHSADETVIVPDLDVLQAGGVGDTLKCGNIRANGIHGQVKDGTSKAETRSKTEGNSLLSRTNGNNLIVEYLAGVCFVAGRDSIAVLVKVLFGRICSGNDRSVVDFTSVCNVGNGRVLFMDDS